MKDKKGLFSYPRLRFINLLNRDHEERYLEFKPPSHWKYIKLQIVKTALGMVNIRDGGTIIIGVSEKNGDFYREGLTDKQIETYKPFDKVKAYVNRHCDPFIDVELHPCEWKKKRFLAIEVHEFNEIPVICSSSRGLLQKNAVYTRPWRTPGTEKVSSQTEMREIISLAIDKGIRNFIERKLPEIAIEITALKNYANIEKRRTNKNGAKQRNR